MLSVNLGFIGYLLLTSDIFSPMGEEGANKDERGVKRKKMTGTKGVTDKESTTVKNCLASL